MLSDVESYETVRFLCSFRNFNRALLGCKAEYLPFEPKCFWSCFLSTSIKIINGHLEIYVHKNIHKPLSGASIGSPSNMLQLTRRWYYINFYTVEYWQTCCNYMHIFFLSSVWCICQTAVWYTEGQCESAGWLWPVPCRRITGWDPYRR
jgi:hypothetical protein